MATETVATLSNSRPFLPASLADLGNRSLAQAGGIASMIVAAISHGEGYSDEDLQAAIWAMQDLIETSSKVINSHPGDSASSLLRGD